MTATPCFADLTTIGVGGRIACFMEPDSRAGIIEAVRSADSQGRPLCVIGGGSNMLVCDEPFDGVVIRDARRGIRVSDEKVSDDGGVVRVVAEAGVNWDDFVRSCVVLGLEGVEGLSGVPGTVGASVVQNIGAYGQEVGTGVESVEAWDREAECVVRLTRDRMRFGYRSSILKSSMYQAPATPDERFFPTPRYVVLSVTFVLRHSATGLVGFGQLARALGVNVGDRLETSAIREAVLSVRAAKGMLEDPNRYATEWMHGTKRDDAVAADLERLRDANGDGSTAPDYNRHSCGSFFMNPVLPPERAALLPDDAPKFAALLPGGDEGVKTSAAWLIDHAGCHRGFSVDGAGSPSATLSTKHTLALTNRGAATARDVADLARAVRDRVEQAFGIRLVPEPVTIGIDLR